MGRNKISNLSLARIGNTNMGRRNGTTYTGWHFFFQNENRRIPDILTLRSLFSIASGRFAPTTRYCDFEVDGPIAGKKSLANRFITRDSSKFKIRDLRTRSEKVQRKRRDALVILQWGFPAFVNNTKFILLSNVSPKRAFDPIRSNRTFHSHIKNFLMKVYAKNYWDYLMNMSCRR